MYSGNVLTTCDEPVHADLGLKALRDRDFRILQLYSKVMCMNDKKLPFKLLSNEWNEVKCKVALEYIGLPEFTICKYIPLVLFKM